VDTFLEGNCTMSELWLTVLLVTALLICFAGVACFILPGRVLRKYKLHDPRQTLIAGILLIIIGIILAVLTLSTVEYS
jgi:threonine/homoserine/homoserine lactone efflux protein